MKRRSPLAIVITGCIAISAANRAGAQNWPQWRGANRDAKVTGFKAPATWPKELTQKWKVTVGEGPSSPALVDGELYVIGRQEGNEVVRCLDAATGNEIWQDKYDAPPPMGPAAAFSGPRSSPTVADGKVITLGVHGTLTCYDAANGNKLWRKDGFEGGLPRFDPASSPIVMDGVCIAQVGGDRGGGIVAYDLATGDEKWKWTGDGPAYASPAVLTIDGEKAIVAVTASKLVAINAADGKNLWQTSYTQGRYNAATPIVAGQTVIYAGPTSGITAVSMEKDGDALAAKPRWKNPDNSLMYNTPVLHDGWLYGISNLNSLFCVNAETGESAWSAPLGQPAGGAPPASASGEKKAEASADSAKKADAPVAAADQKAGDKKGGPGGPPGGPGMRGGKGMRGGMRGGMGGGGYGSVVDAGKVLVALIPSGQLVVFEPNEKEFKQIASYKVADGDAYAYPILSGNKIFVRDKDSLVAWTIE